eukprot:3134819-Rhodomonas_salina.3
MRCAGVRVEQAAVQVGDVFALLIEFYYSEQHYEQAYQMIEKMRQVTIPFLRFPHSSESSCRRKSRRSFGVVERRVRAVLAAVCGSADDGLGGAGSGGLCWAHTWTRRCATRSTGTWGSTLRRTRMQWTRTLRTCRMRAERNTRRARAR